MRSRVLALTAAAALLLTLLPAAGAVAQQPGITDACPESEVDPAGFADVQPGATHAASIDCVAWWRVAQGRDADRYDPGGFVTRAQMASFIARLIRTPGGRLPASPADHFADDDGSVHHFAINRLAEVGVVLGRSQGTYGPSDLVSREQMATFLVRAYEQRTGRSLPAGSGDAFTDIDRSTHRENINKAARAGFTQGVGEGRYAPGNPVTRAQMGSFLARTLQGVADQGVVTDSPTTLRMSADLREFPECDELLGYVKEHALEQVGPYGLDGGVGILPIAEPAPAAPEDDAADGGQGGGPRAGEDFSDTNIQEEGVDEADIVKTDGQRILTITGSTLRWIDVTGAAPQQVGALELGDSWGGELLVHGDRALVQRTEWRWPEGPTTVLTVVDVSAPDTMRELDRLTVEGSLLSSRMVDGIARVVLRSDATPTFVQPDGWEEEDLRAAERRNREIVEQSTISDWLPAYVDCRDVARPPEYSGLGTLSVVTVNVGAGQFVPDSAATVLAGGETVYASPTGLYVATGRWDAWGRGGDPAADMTSEIHAFDISDPARATYRASGKVPGWILNQFALSEQDGFLRVASTSQPIWWGDSEEQSESYVTVLAQQGPALVQVGQVRGLGPDERIYAVRFLGDTAYVVTFREVDPLYVIDLSDPTSPVARGELKITGFSAYLHPVADGLLLGVGQDATEDGWQLGTQLSLFDVSDPANPTRRHQATVEGGYSEVEYDHRAFLYWPQTGLVMLPVRNWETGFAGAIGWDLDVASGFSELGRVEHPRPEGQGGFLDHDEPVDRGEPWVDPAVRRSIVIGGSVYTLSSAGLMRSALDTLDEEGWVAFD